MDSGAEHYRRFLNGDNDALIEIMRDHKDGLILYFNSFVHDICISEELAEETFVKLVMKRPRFSGKSRFKTWLYAIGRNTVVDYLRKSTRHRAIPIDECYDYSDEATIEDTYIRQEEQRILHRVMNTLHTDYSQVLYLIHFEGFSNEEAAAILHKSKRQVENLIYCAKKSLKTALEKEGFRYEGL